MQIVKQRKLTIEGIPAIEWGESSDKVYIFVHGKMSNKESAKSFAELADSRGYQVLSFDLPEHGERSDTSYRCDVWNGVRDLGIIAKYSKENWSHISLFGCSLGAYFSLLAYKDEPIESCLFQSPILDMQQLIGKMFQWFQVSEEQLKEKLEIPTPIDTLRWDYYNFVKEHPIECWDIPTKILYGSSDDLQELSVMEAFSKKYNCSLTIAEGCNHAFSGEGQSQIVHRWIEKHIEIL